MVEEVNFQQIFENTLAEKVNFQQIVVNAMDKEENFLHFLKVSNFQDRKQVDKFNKLDKFNKQVDKFNSRLCGMDRCGMDSDGLEHVLHHPYKG